MLALAPHVSSYNNCWLAGVEHACAILHIYQESVSISPCSRSFSLPPFLSSSSSLSFVRLRYIFPSISALMLHAHTLSIVAYTTTVHSLPRLLSSLASCTVSPPFLPSSTPGTKDTGLCEVQRQNGLPLVCLLILYISSSESLL